MQPVDLCLQADLDIKETLEQIYDIEKDCFSDVYSLDSIKRAYKDEAYDIFVMLYDEKVLGYIISYTVLDEAEILRAAVKSGYRNIAIGEALLGFAENKMKEKGANSVILECRESNAGALALYKKCGFLELGKRRDFYENPRENAIIMKKEI